MIIITADLIIRAGVAIKRWGYPEALKHFFDEIPMFIAIVRVANWGKDNKEPTKPKKEGEKEKGKETPKSEKAPDNKGTSKGGGTNEEGRGTSKGGGNENGGSSKGGGEGWDSPKGTPRYGEDWSDGHGRPMRFARMWWKLQNDIKDAWKEYDYAKKNNDRKGMEEAVKKRDKLVEKQNRYEEDSHREMRNYNEELG